MEKLKKDLLNNNFSKKLSKLDLTEIVKRILSKSPISIDKQDMLRDIIDS